MLQVDGSDGGGQLVRSSLALATLTGRAVRIDGIRGGRPDPGLKHQHLTAAQVAADATDAAVEGAELGSERLVFDPGPVDGGRVEADVGTAGSVTLVFDAVLPLAAALDDHLAVTVRGGTDVEWSPPLDYLRYVKLPLLRDHGWAVAVDAGRRGFYPEGGGEATLHLWPSDPEPISLTGDDPERAWIRSVESEHLAEGDVARRQASAAAYALAEAGIDAVRRSTTTVEAACPGSVVVLGTRTEGSVAGASALGEQGTPAETVGEDAAGELLETLRGPAAVDEHLADQLLVPATVAGGTLAISERTEHVQTSLDLLEAFGVEASVTEREHGALVRVSE